MCSSISSRQAAATTPSLFQSASSDICSRENDKTEFHHLYISWTLAADAIGNPRPRMHWLFD